MEMLIKWVLVLALMSGGALFLAQGIGIETPLDKYKKSEGGGILVGLGLFAAGAALAAFWKIETDTARFDGENSMDGGSSRSRKIIKVERQFKNPQ